MTLPVIPKDGKDAKVVHEFLTQQRDSYASYAELLDEPWKSHFVDAKNRINDFLKNLSPTDQVPAAIDANNALGCMFSLCAQLSALTGMMATTIKTASTSNNAAVDAVIKARITSGDLFGKDALATKIAEGIQAKVTAGELVEKKVSEQLCADAKKNGQTEGEQKVRGEIDNAKKVADLVAARKEVLVKASLPIPEDDIINVVLGGTDAEFAASKTLAEARIADFKKERIVLAADSVLLRKVWLDEKGFKPFDVVIKSTPALKGTPGNPFAGGGVGANTSEVLPV